MKLLIGGSPCTHWSIAQTKNRETEASGIGWELFLNYRIARDKYKPDYFLYENNKSMSPAIRTQITAELGVEPVLINSALVSAQNRQRLYWVGRRNPDGTYSQVSVEQPEDRGILLRDILETGVCWRDKSYTLDANYYKGGNLTSLEKQSGKRLMAAEPINVTADDKSHTLKAQYYKNGIANFISNDGFDATAVAEPINDILQVGAMPRPDGEISTSAGFRIYSTEAKGRCLCANGGGAGAKTGLYAIPYEIEFDDDGRPIKAIGKDGKEITIYEVRDGKITIKGKQYPIKLKDGYYIIRKLTVSECKRLQTVPEWYEFPVSNSQAYKMLGNGWTCEVIAHLIRSCMAEQWGGVDG